MKQDNLTPHHSLVDFYNNLGSLYALQQKSVAHNYNSSWSVWIICVNKDLQKSELEEIMTTTN